MPYIVSSIIAAVAALVILLTRYEPDDSSIKIELERMRSMILVIDGFVDTYIQSGGDMSEINFQKLEEDGILPENIKREDDPKLEDGDGVVSNLTSEEDEGTAEEFKSNLVFPKSEVIWQLIPNTKDNTSYKILVDMKKNPILNSRAGFTESFLGKEYCEKALFGKFISKGNSYDDSIEGKETFTETGTNKDAKFVCIVYK
ncbi:hypothetical protein [Poseidonibacter antarcticus]|uniref:hypothetical protein n=1 Tax=Poseidonibacter antarcticus TaxID=2478538 RepID=UPI000EF4D5B6|nr:hypothetical protein [Poseidonibacter antarcticus]